MHPPKKKTQASSRQECPHCAQLAVELQKFKELAGRAQADLQNAKDRLQKEAEDMRKYALEGMLIELLPTIDNFQRAFEHLPEDLQDHDWVKGVAAMEQEFMGRVQSMGLTKIEALNEPVDPEKHEVLQTGPGKEGKVIEVFEEGYMFNGKVLRPAKVKVGSGDVQNNS